MTNRGCMAMTLKSKPNHPNGSVQKDQKKVWLTVFFDCKGMRHHEFLPQDRGVNKEHKLDVMRRLREAIPQSRTELWKSQSWIDACV